MINLIHIALFECYGGYRWYVLEGSHVLAQGFNRSFKRAETAAESTKADFMAEVGVFT